MNARIILNKSTRPVLKIIVNIKISSVTVEGDFRNLDYGGYQYEGIFLDLP